MHIAPFERIFVILILTTSGSLVVLQSFLIQDSNIHATTGGDNTNNQASNSPNTTTTTTATSRLISEIFNKVKDSVVEITVVGNVINPKITVDGTPLVYSGGGSGSGFIVDMNGNIVTNDHVTGGAEEIYVKFASGNSYPATIIGEDPYTDLAVIQVDSPALFRENLKPLRIENYSDVRVGEQVFAVGSPAGLTLSVSEGIISQVDRIERDLVSDRFWTGGLIQTDAAINPGNSGGPLLNLEGDVVGINEFGLIDPATGTPLPGLNFAISAATLQRIVPELISQSRYEHPWLGLEITDVTPDFADFVGLPEARGVFVKSIVPGAPAETVGITPFTIIFSVDNNIVRDKSELIEYIENNVRPGQEISFNIIDSDRSRRDITFTVGQREEPF